MDFTNGQMSLFEDSDLDESNKQDTTMDELTTDKHEAVNVDNVEELDISFEEALKELDQIVQELQRSDLALDKSMELFRRGTQLIQFSKEKLDEAEQEVTELLKSGEEVAFD